MKYKKKQEYLKARIRFWENLKNQKGYRKPGSQTK